MKTPQLGHVFVLTTFFVSGGLSTGYGQGGTLFPSGQFEGAIYGEAAQGNVDVSPQQTVTHSVNTVTVSVAAPAAPPAPPSTSGSETSIKRRLKMNVQLRSTGSASDPTITRTYKSRRITSKDVIEHNAGGGGLKFGYFFCRYAGIDLNTTFLGGQSYNTLVTSDLILRYPFEFGAQSSTAGYSKDGKDGKESKTVVSGPTWGLAPYILLGGGGQWDGRPAGVGEVGGGVEFRFKEHYGIFVDGRWVAHDARQNYAAETAGFSYNF